MKNKMHRLWISVLALQVLAGCATNRRFQRVEDIAPNEAVAVAKIRILYNGKDKTKGSCVIFDAPAPNRFGYDLDESGYVFAKFPLGRTSVETILHPNGLTQRRFRPGELACEFTEGGAIYYIGDITLNWQGTGSVKTWALASVVGIVPAAIMTEKRGQILVSVESNPAPAQEMFRKKFSSERNLKQSLLEVKPQL